MSQNGKPADFRVWSARCQQEKPRHRDATTEVSKAAETGERLVTNKVPGDALIRGPSRGRIPAFSRGRLDDAAAAPTGDTPPPDFVPAGSHPLRRVRSGRRHDGGVARPAMPGMGNRGPVLAPSRTSDSKTSNRSILTDAETPVAVGLGFTLPGHAVRPVRSHICATLSAGGLHGRL